MLTRPIPRAAILFSALVLPILNGASAHAQPCSESLFPGRLFEAGVWPRSVSLGDLDGDSDLDMVMTQSGYEDDLDDVGVLLNQYIQFSLCPADMNPECVLNIFDVFAFLNAFTSADPAADFTGNGTFDIVDVFAFLNAYNAGCPEHRTTCTNRQWKPLRDGAVFHSQSLRTRHARDGLALLRVSDLEDWA